MFVKKSTYEALKQLYEGMEFKVFMLEEENAILTKRVVELLSEEHECDGYCEGCANLINADRKLCALDRKCKDYK